MNRAENYFVPSAQLSLDALFDTIIDAIIVIDSRGTIIGHNKATLGIFGYEADELLGRNVNMLMPEPYHTQHDGYIQRYEHTGEKKIIGIGREVKGRKKNGDVFPARLAVNHFREQDRNFYVGTIHDISEEVAARQLKEEYSRQLEQEVQERTRALNELLEEQKVIEKELRESQKIYTLIARNYPNGSINLLDAKLNYLFVEGRGLSDYGVDTRYLIGTSFIDRLRDEVRDVAMANLKLMQDGEPRSFELEYHGNHFLIDAVPIKDKNGKINKILLIETNITQLKNAEKEVRDALVKERELGEMKSRFVSLASHEFRTPLSTILSSASLIERYNEAGNHGKVYEHAEKIRKNIRNLNLILNDFLSLGKLEEGLIKNAPQEFSIAELSAEVAEDLAPMKKSGQQVVLHCENVSVELDRELMRNILVNLVSNGLKYSGENGSVDLSCKAENGGLLFTVSDNGMGIPLADQDKLFSRFYRAGNALNLQGTGLGLHIVRNYLELMGGSISFESEIEKGTTFYIRIPNCIK